MPTLFEASRSSDPFERLNPQQRAAVRHGDGPLLVVAGAGTGKTRVITERIRALLDANPELSGENILGLTFTDKAAGVMRQRVVDWAGERGKGVWLGTFHSFCLDVVLAEANPGVQVLEKEDHWILLRRNLPALALQHYLRLAEPGQFLGDFVDFFSRCQDELVTPGDYQHYAEALGEVYEREKGALDADARREREEEIARQQEVARVYRTSERLLREGNRMTFGRMLLEAVEQLQNDGALVRNFRERFRYVLVDEFQDTNIAQIELLWLLAGEHRNIVAVGDDDQAIYRFRGASFGSFTIFLEKFAGTSGASRERERPVALLTQNYRSTARILRVAGQVIAQNERSPLLPKKELAPQKPPGAKVRLLEFASAAAEAHWVAEELERLHSEGKPWKSCAALYRLHTHRDHLVEALTARGVPFVIRNLSILNNPVVRDVIAYLRLVHSTADNVACARVLAAPAWGLEPLDLARLCERASRSRGISLWDALASAQSELPFRREGLRTADLIALITNLRKRAAHIPASELLAALLAQLDVSVAASESDRKYAARFADFVRAWETKSETRQLAEFVEYLDFYDQAGGEINLEEEVGGNAVQLMTVHAAKGLEFDHVFVIRLVQGSFPFRTRPRMLEFPEALMKEERPRGDFHIQEERRLFYVAMTRAKELLRLSTVVHKHSKPSVFLDDILLNTQLARRDVERLTPKVEAPLRAPRVSGPAATPEPDLFRPAGERPRIYSQIARWAEVFRPPVLEPLHLSASAIDSYDSCPQKYLFEQEWKIRSGPRAATSFGSVMHTTIKHFIEELRKGRTIPFADVETIFLREWTSAGFEDAYQEELYRKEGLEQLRAFHAKCLDAPPEVLAQEKFFELPLENNIVITGRMDQVNRVAPGEEEIVDYKTGRPKTEEAARRSLQLSLYALAAREELELHPARLVFYNLQTNEAVTTTRNTKQLDAARQKVQEVAGDIRAGEFPTKPGFACKSCEFEPLCPAHEKLVAISAPRA